MEVFGRGKRHFLRLKHGIPSHDTFSRVFRQRDPKPFQACFVRFMERFAQGLDSVSPLTARRFGGCSIAPPVSRLCTWSTPGRSISGCCLGLAAIGKMVRTRQTHGKTSTETSYYTNHRKH